MTKTFKDLGLSEQTLKAIETMGYKQPTPVQEQAIPVALQGRDVIAAAQTGTGKTAAFVLPTLDRLGHTKKRRSPTCLVITPTRELAQQIDKVARQVGKYTNHRVLTVVGGVKYDKQFKGLDRGIDILVATPGRLIDLLERKAVSLAGVEILVLDEADRMLDMGFWPDVRRIVGKTPSERQTLFFSATISSDIQSQANALLKNPAFVEISKVGDTSANVEEFIMPIEQKQKADLLIELLGDKGGTRILVFTRTKSRADSTARRLAKRGFKVDAMHADRSQNQRERALSNFHNGKIDVLVATDVLARGIDVSEVNYVVNYDVPVSPKDYVHRIGRTGRAGEDGAAYTFVGPEEVSDLREIEYMMGKIIPTYDIDGFDYQPGRIVPSATRPAKRGARRAFRGSRGRGISPRRR